MNGDRIRLGMKLKIIKIDITHKRHNSCSEMENMVGKSFKVSKVRKARDFLSNEGFDENLPENHRTITFGDDLHGYVWAPEDLEYSGPKVKLPKKATFNPDDIVRS